MPANALASAPETLRTRPRQEIGWKIGERGFDIVLSPAVPSIARERLRPDVDAFLEGRGLAREDIASWVCPRGGL